MFQSATAVQARIGLPVRGLFPALVIRMRPVEWAVLALMAFEVPSVYYSQERANSVGAAEVVALSDGVYFATRLLFRAPLHAAWFAAFVGFGGAFVAIGGINQFVVGTRQLASAPS